jgi:hypothetical protein
MANGGIALQRAVVENFDVPQYAQTLLGWRPIAYPCDQPVNAAEESLLLVFDIQGGDYNFQPQEVICGNIANSFGSVDAEGGMLHSMSEYYDVFAPVKPTDILNVGVEPCDVIAGNTRVGVEFTWTNVKLPMLPTIRSKCSRETAVNAAGRTLGETLKLDYAHKLIELGGVWTSGPAQTVEEENNTTLIINCSALKVNEVKMMFEPVGAIANLAEDQGRPRAYLARRAQRLDFNQEAVTIFASYDVDVATTAVGQAVYMVRYI